MMKKRLLSLLLCVCMVAGVLLPSAAAASPTDLFTQVKVLANGSGATMEDTFESGWNKVATSGGTITLMRHITASGGSFGTGAGFLNGAILVPAGKTITLDLNGATVNRGLTSVQSDGCVFVVRGTLNLINGSNSVATIKGGADSTYGGVYVSGSLTVSGAINITENKSSKGTANVYLPNGKSITSKGLGNGSRIGVTTASAPAAGGTTTIATGSITETDVQRFTSDGGYPVEQKGASIVLKGPALPQAQQIQKLPQAQQQTSNSSAQSYSLTSTQSKARTVSTATPIDDDDEKDETDPTYTVTFDLNYDPAESDDSTVSPEKITVTLGKTYGEATGLSSNQLPEPSEREGYSFLGWYYNSQNTTPVTSGSKITASTKVTVSADHTLYALWRKVSSESGTPDEGTTPDESNPQYILITFMDNDNEYGRLVEKNTTIILPSAEECGFSAPEEGQALKGWSTTKPDSSPDDGNDDSNDGSDDGNGSNDENTASQSDSSSSEITVEYKPGQSAPFSADTTLYAVWDTAISVTLDANEGHWTDLSEDDTTRTVSVTAGTYTAAFPEPERGRYSFTGWYSDSNGGSPVESIPSTATDNDPYTLYAHWEQTEFKVSFDAGYPDGTLDESDFSTKTITEKDYTLPTSEPTRAGYQFAGWKVGDDLVGATYTLTEDVTFTATWNKEFTVSYDVGNGCTNSNEFTSQTAVENDSTFQIHSATPTRDGYTFKEWQIGDTSETLAPGDRYTVTSDVTLNAVWIEKKQHTVTYNLDGGTPEFENDIAVEGETFHLPATKPTKEGFTFAGWKDDSHDELWQAGAEYTYEITADVTFTAQWGKPCTVTFDANGGKIGTDDSVQLEYALDSQYGELPTATWDGYRFDGWFTKSAGGTEINSDSTVTEDCTLYAHWSQLITLTYDPNGGTWSDASGMSIKTSQGVAGESVPFPSDLTYSGYTLTGWKLTSDDPDDSDDTVHNGSFKIPDNPATQYTFTAQWEEKDEAEFWGDDAQHTAGSFEEMWELANVENQTSTVRLLDNAETSDALTIAASANITLDLNGYTLTRTFNARTTAPQENGYVIYVSQGTTFTLTDSTDSDGTVTGGNNIGNGGGVYNAGTFIMEGGSITGNHAHISQGSEFDGNGGGVYNQGTFTMKGGSIKNNSAEGASGMGGGVYVAANSQMTMDGGEISGNSAWTGGALYDKGGIVHINGGSITKNISNNMTRNANILSYGTLTISGSPKITGNTLEGDGPSADIYIDKHYPSIKIETLNSGAKIDIRIIAEELYEANKAIATGVTERDLPYLHVTNLDADSEYTTVLEGDNWKLSKKSSTSSYTITFNANGGKFANGVETQTKSEIAPDTTFENVLNGVSAPTRDGYVFDGWYTDANCTTAVSPTGAVTENATLYAKWTAAQAQCTINGVTTYGTFAAMWDKAIGAGGTVKLLQDVTAVKGSFGTDGDGRLYINPNQTITLDLNGYTLNRNAEGLNQPAGQVIYNSGTLTIKDTSESRTGKITGGYSVASGGAVAGNGGGIENTGTLTLEGGSITGNYTEGSGGGVANIGAGQFFMTGGSITGNIADKSGGGVYQDPQEPNQTGKFTMSGGTITENTAETGGGVSGAITVSGNPQIFGNTDTEENSSDVRGNITVSSTLDDNALIGVDAANPAEGEKVGVTVKEASDVNKFFSDEDGFKLEKPEDSNELIFAKAETYEVTLNANGGTMPDGVSDKVTVTVGNTYSGKLPVPVRAGYTFEGWYTAAEGGNPVTAADRVVENGPTTLYAHWTADSTAIYTVMLNANGGSVSPSSITVNAGGVYSGLPTPTRSNSSTYRYTFAGWFTAPTGGSQVSNGSPLAAQGNHTLYAHWTATRITSSNNSSSSSGSSSGSSGGSGSSSDLYITASAGTGGSINPSGQSKVASGSSKTYTITPNAGYVISDVLIDGKSIGAVNSYTFTNITASHTIRAAFIPATTNIPMQPTTTTTTSTNYSTCTKDANCPIAVYSDAQPTAWYHDGVHYCINNKLMTGTSATTFEPNTPLSRAMLAQILYNREGSPTVSSGSSGFSDVASGAWYENAIKRAAATGLMVGYENGTYGPNDAITREQLAVVLWRHAGSPVPAVSTVPFDDYRNTREFARDAVRWAYGRGIINGKADGTLDPGGRASRAEVAQMLKNYLTT